MNDDTHFLYSMSAALASEGKDYHSQRCREIGDAIARLRAQTADWQPIDSAPKDGTDILVWEPWCLRAVVVFWDGDSLLNNSAWRVRWDAAPIHLVTHWMPLPPPPCSDARSQSEPSARSDDSAKRG